MEKKRKETRGKGVMDQGSQTFRQREREDQMEEKRQGTKKYSGGQTKKASEEVQERVVVGGERRGKAPDPCEVIKNSSINSRPSGPEEEGEREGELS